MSADGVVVMLVFCVTFVVVVVVNLLSQRAIGRIISNSKAKATPHPRWSPIDPATIAELGMRPKGVIKR